MTNIGDLLGNSADKIFQDSVKIGDVHLLSLDASNGITPKNGDTARNKFFIVLGFDKDGNVIGGVVINSNINYNLPSVVTDYQLPVKVQQCPFLRYNSFVNCSRFVTAKKTKFTRRTYRGTISDTELLELITNTLKESPTVSPRILRKFGII